MRVSLDGSSLSVAGKGGGKNAPGSSQGNGNTCPEEVKESPRSVSAGRAARVTTALQRHLLQRAHGPNAFCAPLNSARALHRAAVPVLVLVTAVLPSSSQPQHTAPVLLNQPEPSCRSLSWTLCAGQHSS